MDARKKEMAAAYKERELVGGVYAIKNTQSGKSFFDATTDIRGARNRFEFGRKTNVCSDKRIEPDWKKYGAEAFVFETLEEITKGAAQTDAEFKADVSALKDLWLEKLSGEPLNL